MMDSELFDFNDSARPVSGRGEQSSPPSVIDNRESLDVKHILQPRTVTYARYRFSKLHRAMLIHIREELQAYITNRHEEISSKELITVPLFVSHYPTFRGDTKLFMKSVVQLMKKEGNIVCFEWCFNSEMHKDLFMWMQRGVKGSARLALPKDGDRIKQASAIIVNAVQCENEPGKIVVSVNPVVLPFLLYYGPGVGGTIFDRDVSLKLQSSYSSRLYEMIMDWSSCCSTKEVSLDYLKNILMLPQSYTVKDIRRRVLDVAVEEINACAPSLVFEYKLKYNVDYGYVTGSRGRYPFNCVAFTFSKKEFFDWAELSRKQVLIMLQGIADRECHYMCEPLARQIVQNGQDSKIKAKFAYYDKKVSSRQMTPEEYKNTMLKIVREITGTDLRSGYHIRNSVKASKKYISSGNEPKLLFD